MIKYEINLRNKLYLKSNMECLFILQNELNKYNESKEAVYIVELDVRKIICEDLLKELKEQNAILSYNQASNKKIGF